MPKTERDPLGPGFEWRLRVALDRIQPRNSEPRYRQAAAVRAWRVAPLALAAAVAGFLVLMVYAAAGDSSPSEIGHRIVTAIQPKQEPSPTPPPTSPAAPVQKAAPVAEPSQAQDSAEPKRTAEPGDAAQSGNSSGPPDRSRPRPTPSPEPNDR